MSGARSGDAGNPIRRYNRSGNTESDWLKTDANTLLSTPSVPKCRMIGKEDEPRSSSTRQGVLDMMQGHTA